MISLNEQSDHLSFWHVGDGVTRIQTRCPKITRELRRLKDTHQAGESVTGDYLRLFDSRQPFAKLRKTLKRIQRRTKGAFLPSKGLSVSPASASKNRGSINIPASTNGKNKGIFLAGSGQPARQDIGRAASETDGNIAAEEGSR